MCEERGEQGAPFTWHEGFQACSSSRTSEASRRLSATSLAQSTSAPHAAAASAAATDTSAGLGIMSNLVVDSLKGLTDETPFANMSDCLSVLDRRFWCLDTRLDTLPAAPNVYTQFTTGGFSQRPVEPDLIDAVLNTDDLFRDQRYGWITFRSNTTDGSIRNATREMRSLERRLRKQREALMRQKGLDKA